MGKTWMVVMTMAAGAAFGHINNLRINGVLVATNSGSSAMDTPVPAGSTATVTWSVSVAHGSRHILFLSRNGGTSWDSVAGVPAANTTGNKTLQWTVPSTPAAQAKIRLYQATPGEPTSNTSDDYNLVSGVFVISPSTPLLPGERARILSFRQGQENLRVELQSPGFTLAEISDLNGAVLRSMNLGKDAREIVFPTAGLPRGKSVFRLLGNGGASYNRLVVIRP